MGEVPQIQFVDNHVHIPLQKHRHVPMIQKVQKTVEVPVIETIEKVVDVPVVKQIEIPQIQTIEKIVEIPYIQTVEKTVEVPQAGETVNGGQRSVTMTLETVPRRPQRNSFRSLKWAHLCLLRGALM